MGFKKILEALALSFTLYSCETAKQEESTIKINVNPSYFVNNYAGEDSNGMYFYGALKNRQILLTPNPEKNKQMHIDEREYSNLDSLELKKTGENRNKMKVYTIESVILKK